MRKIILLSLHMHSLPEAQGSGPLTPWLGKLQAPHNATGVSLWRRPICAAWTLAYSLPASRARRAMEYMLRLFEGMTVLLVCEYRRDAMEQSMFLD